MEKAPQSIESEEYKRKRRKFFSTFVLTNRNTLKIHREFGILAKEAKFEKWRNVSEHCLIEAVAADTLAREFKFTEDERNKLITAAFLHDFYKRKQIETFKKAKEIGVLEIKKSMKDSEEKSKEELKKHGYSKEMIQIASACGPLSLTRMRESDVSLLEKLMHYIDDITLNNDLVLLDDRINANENNQNYKESNESAGEDKDFVKVFGENKTYFEVQREVGHEIEKELANRIGLSDSKELPNYLKSKIKERILKSE